MKAVPFHSQMVNWDNEDAGFPSAEAVQQRERNCCGIACLRMVLSYFRVPNNDGKTTYWNLLQAGLARGAYNDIGWIHRGLLGMAGEFGIRGQCHRRRDVGHLIAAIRGGSICIVSITRYFLGGEPDHDGNALAKGGHLVVAYDLSSQGGAVTGIVCHHPSSGRQWNKQGWPVDLEKWERSFSGNYIEFYSRQGESA